jgi:hypothetical protein
MDGRTEGVCVYVVYTCTYTYTHVHHIQDKCSLTGVLAFQPLKVVMSPLSHKHWDLA